VGINHVGRFQHEVLVLKRDELELLALNLSLPLLRQLVNFSIDAIDISTAL